MANPLELLQGIGGVVINAAREHSKVTMVAASGLVAGGIVVMGGSGGEVSPTVTIYHDPTPTTPGLLARTRTPTAVKSATREPTRTSTVESRKNASVTFDGVTYTTTPSDNNAACGTTQITRYLMTDDQLRKIGYSRGDILYMKRGQNNPKLAWSCGFNGQKIIK